MLVSSHQCVRGRRAESGRNLRGWSLDWQGPWEAPQHDVDWAKERPFFEDVVQKGVDIVHRTQLPVADEWVQALNDGDAYAFVAILLSQFSNIRSLQLDYSFVWMGGYPGWMVKQLLLLSKNGVVANTFGSLRSVDYGGNVPPPEQWEIPMHRSMPDGFPLSYNQDQSSG